MTGVAVKTLQTALPDACVLYSSATGASGMCLFKQGRHMCARSPHWPPRCAQEPVTHTCLCGGAAEHASLVPPSAASWCWLSCPRQMLALSLAESVRTAQDCTS